MILMVPGNKAYLFILLILGTSSLTAQSVDYKLPNASTYVGSTPCDPFIHDLLKIPAQDSCEFMKWNLQMQGYRSDSFFLTIYYGKSRPNTNWFMNDGYKMELRGTYLVGKGNAANPKKEVYQLKVAGLRSTINLIKMNASIFHFADDRKNFLVGNGGFSYVLNRQP